MATDKLGIVPQLLAIEAKPRRFALWSAGDNWPYRKEGPTARHRQMFSILRFLLIANMHCCDNVR
jgi:hypothetical protein